MLLYMGSLKLTKPRAAMLNTINNDSFVVDDLLGTVMMMLMLVHIVFGCVSAVLYLATVTPPPHPVASTSYRVWFV